MWMSQAIAFHWKQEKTQTTNNRKNTIPQLEIEEAY